MDFNFRLADSEKDIDRLANFLLPRPLNYRGYTNWLERAIEELYLEYKQAAMGFSYGYLVASLMFQPHKSIKGFCELKNARTLEEFQGGKIQSLMRRQVEILAKKQGYWVVQGDARADRLDIILPLLADGYKEVARADLYNEGYEDVVLVKPLIEREEKSWL